MFVVDSKGAQWAIDEGLRERASALIDSFHDKIGYVDLDKIIFLRLTGASKSKWLGKCMYIGKCPMNIIPKFIVHRLQSMGLLNLAHTSFEDGEVDIFDLRYMIILNDDLIQSGEGDIQKIEDITLYHELRHIHPDEDKMIKHDLEDFRDIVATFGPYWTDGIFEEEEADDSEVDEVPSPVMPPQFPTIPLSASSDEWNPPESD